MLQVLIRFEEKNVVCDEFSISHLLSMRCFQNKIIIDKRSQRIPHQSHHFFSALQQWKNLCNIIACCDWKKTDCKNGITISRLSFNKNDKASVKVKS